MEIIGSVAARGGEREGLASFFKLYIFVNVITIAYINIQLPHLKQKLRNTQKLH